MNSDLQRRVQELRSVCTKLRPDIDDPQILSEYTVVLKQLGIAERELSATPAPTEALSSTSRNSSG